MYQNHFLHFSRLGEQGLGTNGKYIRYASVRFLFFKLTQPAFQKIKKSIHSIRSNCASTKIEAVLIDVYVFKSSPFSSSFFKGAFLLLKSVVWCRRTKNVCERHVPDPTSLSGLPLRESILNYDRNWFRTVLKYEYLGFCPLFSISNTKIAFTCHENLVAHRLPTTHARGITV